MSRNRARVQHENVESFGERKLTSSKRRTKEISTISNYSWLRSHVGHG